MTQKWHSSRKEKPEADTVVIGYWVDADDNTMVALCYLDSLGHGYLAQDEPGADASFHQPKYWIEDPIK